MVNVETVTIRNFLSYGNYETVIDVAKLGQCLITGDNGAGKCLDGGTLVLLSDGRRIPVRNLDKHIGVTLCAIDGDLRNCQATLLAHVNSGHKRCWEMRMRSGRKIVCSLDHRFLSFAAGWRSLRELSVGDYIAVNRCFDIRQTNSDFTKAEAELIGLLLGDGGTFAKCTPSIYISDDEQGIKKRVEALLAEIDAGLRLSGGRGQNRKDKNYRISINVSKTVDAAGVYRQNPVAMLVDRLGLTGVTKERKFIPDAILSSVSCVWKALIVGFWQADGWVSLAKAVGKRKQRIEVGCCNKSENLIRQIQHLLLRLGIRSSIRFRMALCSTTGRRFPSWTLVIQPDCVIGFLDAFGERLKEVGCPIDEAVSVQNVIKNQLFASQNVDLIPSAVWDSTFDLIGHAPSAIAGNKHTYLTGRHATSRHIVSHFGRSTRDARLLALGQSDVVWDEIVAIDSIGVRETFDVQVSSEGCEPNFSANDIITHNSTIPNAILWCLFGRTMHAVKPGDNVVNWQTCKDCMVKVKMKNGDVVTRTRKTEGHNELMVESNGETILATLSTTQNQQAQLNKMYGLDWGAFTGSSFFTQYGKSWLEMPDQFRKAAIERALRIDRLTLYANVAKEKVAAISTNQDKIRAARDGLKRTVASLQEEQEAAGSAQVTFEDERQNRHRRAKDQSIDYLTRAEQMEVPDAEAIKKTWATIEQIKLKVKDLEVKERQASLSAALHRRQANEISDRISSWRERAGKMCIECEQEIVHSHTEGKIAPLVDECQRLNCLADEAESQRQAVCDKIATAKGKIQEATPKWTIKEAVAIKAQRDGLIEVAKRAEELAERILKEDNPHGDAVIRLARKIDEINDKLKAISVDLERLDLLAKHANYIYRAYSDRRKIKSFVIARHIPFVNKRLGHYLNLFNLDVSLKLTESLAIDSSHWGYDWMSGGERKRADMAFMFSMFDLHEALYGRQCNMIVLDEVDGRLDDAGVEAMVSVVRDDLAKRVDAVLVISHKIQMRDYFHQQLAVHKEARLSIIDAAA